MKTKLRKNDLISRIGSDEFCIVMEKIDEIESIFTRLESGMDVVSKPFMVEDKPLYLTMSVGISIFPKDGARPSELIKNADTAMYRVKQEGKNGFKFYDEGMTLEAIASITMENEIRKAIENESFEVYFQPQVDAVNDNLIGMEALIRWNHDELGFIPPLDFLPLAQSVGIMVDIDKIVMKKAVKAFVGWLEEGLKPGKLSMNMTIEQLQWGGFIPFVEELKASFKRFDNYIEFEITEDHLMQDPKEATTVLEQLHALSMSVAIDDFGTGYSSLAYLKRLPIDRLKIDKSFVDDLPDDGEDAAIITAIISLAQALGLDIIAEGVETEAQKAFLLDAKCSDIQGYLYSKPLSQEDMYRYLKGKFCQ